MQRLAWSRQRTGELLGAGAAALLAALALGYLLLVVLPWQPVFLQGGLDASWIAVLPEAFLRHWDFGKDIAFTYGPWGFAIVSHYHPALYGPILGLLAVLAAILTVSLWRTAWLMSVSLPRRILLAAGLTWAIAELIALEPCQFGNLLSWQIPLLHFFVDEPAVPAWRSRENGGASIIAAGRPVWLRTLCFLHNYAVVLSAALISLVKFSQLTLAVCMIAGVSADDVLYRRRFPGKGCAYVLGLVAFWLLARQPLDSLLPYFEHSLAISLSYTEMKESGPWLHIPWYALTAAGTLYLAACAKRPGRGWWAVIPLLTLAAALHVLAKAAFVRHDAGHWPMAFCFLAGCWLTTWHFLRAGTHTRRNRRILRVVAGMVFLAIPLFHPNFFRTLRAIPRQRAQRLLAARDVLTGRANYRSVYEGAKKTLQDRFPIPPMAGTVDLYPTDAAILVAHDVAYRPRPVFQSYVACSATLAAMNADYLRSPRAPDNILFDIQPLSWWSVWHDRGRFPTLDDGLSWPELLTRYDIAAASPQGGKCSYLWLKRSAQPRQYALVPLQQRTIAFEETLRIPSLGAGPIWARIDVSRSLPGDLAALALKDPIVRLEVVTGEKTRTVYRFVPGSARSGFLLSPLIAHRDWYAWFASTPWNDPAWRQAVQRQAIETISLTTKGRWAFRPAISVQFFLLKFAESPNSPCRFRPQSPGPSLVSGGVKG